MKNNHETLLCSFCEQDPPLVTVLLLWCVIGWPDDWHSMYIRQQDFSYSEALEHLIPSWLVLAKIDCAVPGALPNLPINQFKPIQQNRHQALRSYCPNMNCDDWQWMNTRLRTLSPFCLLSHKNEKGYFRTVRSLMLWHKHLVVRSPM